jgi:transcriptional regulator with XRE-family HTH domain
MKDFRPARKRVEVSVGESVRILRELQELSQSQLGALTGIPQATLSAIENGRVNLGVERAKVLARALKCHPAVLVFPGWDVSLESAVQACSLSLRTQFAGNRQGESSRKNSRPDFNDRQKVLP